MRDRQEMPGSWDRRGVVRTVDDHPHAGPNYTVDWFQLDLGIWYNAFAHPKELRPHTPTEDEVYAWGLRELSS